MPHGQSGQLNGQRLAAETDTSALSPVAATYDADPLNSNERGFAEDEPIRLPRNERIRPPFNPKQSCRVGCLNANTMHRVGRTEIVTEEIKRYGLEITGLSETRWIGSGKTRIDGLTFVHSGKEDGTHERGVAIALSSRTENMLERYGCVSERIVWCRLKGRYTNVMVVQVYAPTEEKTDEEKDEFYGRLGEVVRSTKRHDMLLLMGDFNAKVGQEDGTWRDVMGVFGVGNRNNNGQRLLEFCAEHRLCVTNTIFKHKIEHKATWTSPDGVTRNLIDYIVVNKARRSSVLDTRVFRGCKVPTDHMLVVSKLRIKLKAQQNITLQKKYDVDRLKAEDVHARYQAAAGSRFAALMDREDMDAEEQWQSFKIATNDAAAEVIGYRKRQHKPWVSERSRILSEKQRHLRVKADDERNEERRMSLRAERRSALHELHSSLKDDENKFWEEKATEVEDAGRRGESHGMFAAVKFLKGFGRKQSRSSAGIRNEEGVVVSNGKDKNAVFTRYFQRLYNPPINADRDLLTEYEGHQDHDTQAEGVVISENEVESAIKALRNRKAEGVCGIPPELLKYGGADMKREMCRLFNAVLDQERVPEDWKKAIIVPIFKNKGSKLDCENHRGISLLSVPSKTFMRVLLNKIKPQLEEKLREEQAGFRGGRSTIDQIFALRQIIEKRWEYALPVYCSFMDLEKAYDSVWREGMWQIAEYYGIPAKIVAILKSWYDGIHSCVRLDGEDGDWFPISTGLRQGCVMSPSLFNAYMDAMMRKVTEDGAGGIMVGSEKIVDLDFADDVALLADSWVVMVSMVMKMEQVTQRFGINISARKSEVLFIGRDGDIRMEDIELRGQPMKQVDEFTYLGSVISSDGKFLKDIEKRRAAATRAFGMLRARMWGRREISLKVKMKVFNAIVLPVLMYGATAWALTRTEEARLDAFEMGMLRSIVGVRWDDFVRNVDIREMLSQPPVSLKLRKARMKWFGHLERMSDERQVKRISQAEMQGRRPAGRPRTRWRDVLRRDLECSGLSLEEAAAEALDRDRWKRIVRASCDYNAAGS